MSEMEKDTREQKKVVLSDDELEGVSSGLFIQQAGEETCRYCGEKTYDLIGHYKVCPKY